MEEKARAGGGVVDGVEDDGVGGDGVGVGEGKGGKVVGCEGLGREKSGGVGEGGGGRRGVGGGRRVGVGLSLIHI